MPSQGDWDCGNSWRSISNGTVQRPSSWCWWVINEPCGPAWECERPHWGPLAHWCLFHPHWLCRLLRLLHTSSKWTQLQYLFFYGAKYQPALVGHLKKFKSNSTQTNIMLVHCFNFREIIHNLFVSKIEFENIDGKKII